MGPRATEPKSLARTSNMASAQDAAGAGPAQADRVRGWVLQAAPGAVAWAQRAMAVRPDSLDTLAGCDVPALVVVGEEDRLASVEDARAMVDALPRGELVVVEAAGHLAAVELPDAFATALVDAAPRFAR